MNDLRYSRRARLPLHHLLGRDDNSLTFCKGYNSCTFFFYQNLQMGLLRARNVTPSKHGKHYRERSAGGLFPNWTTLHLEDFPYPPPVDVPDISQSLTITINTWTQSSLFKIRKKVFYEKRKIDDIKVAPLFSDNIFPIS